MYLSLWCSSCSSHFSHFSRRYPAHNGVQTGQNEFLFKIIVAEKEQTVHKILFLFLKVLGKEIRVKFSNGAYAKFVNHHSPFSPKKQKKSSFYCKTPFLLQGEATQGYLRNVVTNFIVMQVSTCMDFIEISVNFHLLFLVPVTSYVVPDT